MLIGFPRDERSERIRYLRSEEINNGTYGCSVGYKGKIIELYVGLEY